MLWGIISIFVKGLNALGLDSFQESFFRLLLSTVMMGIFIILKDPTLFRIRIKDVWMFIGSGIFSLLFFNLCYFSAMREIEVGVAVVLLYTSPVFVMILSAVLFHEKITKYKVFVLICAVISCILISNILGGDIQFSLKGLILGIGSGFGYSLYSIFGRFALQKYSSITITFYTFLLALIGSVFFVDFKAVPSSLFSSIGIMHLLGFSFLSTVLPYLLYTKGLSLIQTGKAAILATVEPVVGMLVGIIVFQESITWTKILGAGFMFLSIILLSIQRKNES